MPGESSPIQLSARIGLANRESAGGRSRATLWDLGRWQDRHSAGPTARGPRRADPDGVSPDAYQGQRETAHDGGRQSVVTRHADQIDSRSTKLDYLDLTGPV